jgi:hypothetical protein
LKSDKEYQKGAQKEGGLLEVDVFANQHIAQHEHTAPPKRSCYEVFHVVPDDEQRTTQAFEHPYFHLGPQVATTLLKDNNEKSVSSMPSLWSPRDDSDSSDDNSWDNEDTSAPLSHDNAPEAMSNFTPPAKSSVQA